MPRAFFFYLRLRGLRSGIDGGFDSKEVEYEESYTIVVLPEFLALPFPSVELPEKVDL